MAYHYVTVTVGVSIDTDQPVSDDEIRNWVFDVLLDGDIIEIANDETGDIEECGCCLFSVALGGNGSSND